jgi:hypothetical protein
LLQHRIMSTFAVELPGSEGAVCAFHFFGLGAAVKGSQGLRVVIRNGDGTVDAIELMRLAQNGTAAGERFTVLTSRRPVKTADGKLELNFGRSSFVIPSVKNYILEDAEGRVRFTIHRSSSCTCSARSYGPLSHLIVFGLSVAIVAAAR